MAFFKNLILSFLVILLVGWIALFPDPVHARFGQASLWCLACGLILFVFLSEVKLRLFSWGDWPVWAAAISLYAGTLSPLLRSETMRVYVYLAGNLLLLYYIGKVLKNIKGGVIVFFKTFAVFGGIVALFGLFELVFGHNPLYEHVINNPYYERYSRYAPRPMSTLLNPVVLGSFLLSVIPIAYWLARSHQARNKIFWLTIVFLSSFIAVLTFSRGVILGAIVMVLVWLVVSERWKSAGCFLGCVVLSIAVCSFATDHRFSRLGFSRLIHGSYDSIVSPYRNLRWNVSLDIWRDYPLTGAGFKNYRSLFDYYDGTQEPEIDEFKIADNMYLTLLSESGAIGFCGVTGFFAIMLLRFFNRRSAFKWRRSFLLAPLAAMCGLLVNMLAYDLFYWANIYLVFCLFCGLLAEPERDKPAEFFNENR